MKQTHDKLNRRTMLMTSAAAMVATGGAAKTARAQGPQIVTPPMENRILLSCKLGMIPKDAEVKRYLLLTV